MKPFNLEQALSGKPVITRHGLEVQELYLFNYIKDFPLGISVQDELLTLTKEGKRNKGGYESVYDLFMAPEKITKWIVFLRKGDEISTVSSTYDSEEEARKDTGHMPSLISIIKAEFEV